MKTRFDSGVPEAFGSLRQGNSCTERAVKLLSERKHEKETSHALALT
jgi:hypothetical protein